jgi:hypothetical protein
MPELGVTPSDLFQLARLVSDTAIRLGCSTSEAVEQIEAAALQASPPKPKAFVDFVRAYKRAQLRRNDCLGAPVARDPVWNMMLDLVIAEQEGKSISVSSLCVGSGVPPTTALRYIDRIVDYGMVDRDDDRADMRRTLIRFTPGTSRKVTDILSDIRALC